MGQAHTALQQLDKASTALTQLLDAGTLDNFVSALKNIELPPEFIRFQENISARLLEKLVKAPAFSQKLKIWSEDPAARAQLLGTLAEMHVDAFADELKSMGFNLPRMRPDIKFYDDEKTMPGFGGFDEDLNLIYQRSSYSGFNKPVYALNWVTHETGHYTQYALKDLVESTPNVPGWMKDAVAILHKDLPSIDIDKLNDPQLKKLAHEAYLYRPREADVMNTADVFTEKFLDCSPVMLTSPRRNPMALAHFNA